MSVSIRSSPNAISPAANDGWPGLVGRLAATVAVFGVLAAGPVIEAAAAQEPDYGDLIYLYRDANGVPILDADLCQQPIAFPSDTCLLDCTGLDPCLVAVDPATCAVEVAYAACTKEVEFGRLNEARSPPRVFERQMEERLKSQHRNTEETVKLRFRSSSNAERAV